jgi:hypothetical protein
VSDPTNDKIASEPTNDIDALLRDLGYAASNICLGETSSPVVCGVAIQVALVAPHIEAMLSDIERLRDELAAMQKQRDEAVELYTDLLRRLSGSAPPRAAFLSGDATQKEGGGA